MKYFADNLKFLRKKRGISQGLLAENLGLNRGNIASYEKGIAEPSMNNLMKIVKYFNIDFRDLVETDLANRDAVRAELEKIGESETSLASTKIDPLDLKEELLSNKRKLENFVSQSDSMQKILDGFRQFHKYKMTQNTELTEEVKKMAENYEELLDLMQSMLNMNQDILKSFSRED